MAPTNYCSPRPYRTPPVRPTQLDEELLPVARFKLGAQLVLGVVKERTGGVAAVYAAADESLCLDGAAGSHTTATPCCIRARSR